MSELRNPSKAELLKWISDTLQIKATKIEQLGNGAVACQLVDYLYPTSGINLAKVCWKASSEVDFIRNFRVFADAMAKVDHSKRFDIASLSKGKKPHLLDLGQYLKQTYDRLPSKRFDYDPLKARKNEEIHLLGTKAMPKEKENLAPPPPLACKKVKIEKSISYQQIQEIMTLVEFSDEQKVEKIKSLFL